MPTGIDHIVVAVRDLKAATVDFSNAGFTVTPGGEHTGGSTHNALVAFADGAYIELIAWKDPDTPVDTQWWRRFQAGEGFIDYALRTDDLDAEVARLRASALDVPEPRAGGRTRPDGQRVEWRNLEFGPGSSGSLPFFCHSTNDRSLRVPSGDAAVHPNGVTGVAGITIVADDLEAAAHDYARLTGTEGEELVVNARDAGRGRRFDIGSAAGTEIHLDLVTAAVEDSSLGRVVAERGEVPVMVTLRGDGETEQTIDPGLTHGAVLTIA